MLQKPVFTAILKHVSNLSCLTIKLKQEKNEISKVHTLINLVFLLTEINKKGFKTCGETSCFFKELISCQKKWYRHKNRKIIFLIKFFYWLVDTVGSLWDIFNRQKTSSENQKNTVGPCEPGLRSPSRRDLVPHHLHNLLRRRRGMGDTF